MSVRPSVCPSVRSHFRNRYLSFYWKKRFYIWYMALAWWLVPCLPFPGLPHIYFLFIVRLRIFRVCCNENFRNSYLSFYWKKWFYIWYMALAWWLVLCLPFPGLPHIYFLFTVRLTNEWVGVFLAQRSVQHLVESDVIHHKPNQTIMKILFPEVLQFMILVSILCNVQNIYKFKSDISRLTLSSG